MTDVNLKVRKELLAGLVLYAQALSNLESVGTTNSDTALKSAATQLGSDAKGPAFLTAFSKQNTAAGDAVAGLQTAMDWIILHYRDKHVAAAAAENQGAISDIVLALKQENTLEANQVADSAVAIAQPLQDLTADPQRLAQAANALIIYDSYWGATPAAVPMMSLQTPSPNAANDALDQFLACHTLVAVGGRKELIPKSDLICKLDFVSLKPS